jgi:hypothetical protein
MRNTRNCSNLKRFCLLRGKVQPSQSVIALNSLNQPLSLLETLSRFEIRFDRQYLAPPTGLARPKRGKKGMSPETR